MVGDYKRDLFVCLIIYVALLILIYLYSENYLVLGGEGDYFLDYSLVKDLYRYSWSDLLFGTGGPMPIINLTFFIFDALSLLQQLIPIKAVNLLIISLLYFLPFLSFYSLSRFYLGSGIYSSLMCSLFYLLNPYSVFHINGLMFWNVSPMIALPIAFAIIYKYYYNKFHLFLLFGIFVLIFSFAFSNLPYLGVFHIFIVISSFIVCYFYVHRLNIRHIVTNIILLEVSFLVFSGWWLFNLMRIQLEDVTLFYTKDFAMNWAMTANGIGPIMYKLYAFTANIPPWNDYFFRFYTNSLNQFVFIIPFSIVVIYLILNSRSSKQLEILFFFFLLILFLNKGVNDPFKWVYIWMLENVPLFILFKTPLEKFGVLSVFLFSLCLLIIFNRGLNKKLSVLFFVYLLVCSIPFLSLSFIPDFKVGEDQYVSRKYIDKDEYSELITSLNNDKLQYRYLSLPGSLNYQVTMLNHDNKYYRGMDPIIYAIARPFYAAYSPENSELIYNHLTDAYIVRLLSIYNIRQIVINKDIYPSFGFQEKIPAATVEDYFNKNITWTNGSITLIKNDYFLPLFYTPEKILFYNQTTLSIPEILAMDNYSIRSVIYPYKVFNTNFNYAFPLNRISKYMPKYGNNFFKNTKLLMEYAELDEVFINPIIEFKKINPIKYRLRIHNATGNFSLIFSESFHDGWMAYANTYKYPDASLSESIGNYSIIVGNEDSQATKTAVEQYIQRGWVTCLGDGKIKTIVHRNRKTSDAYSVDFISRNFQGTIQNNNLPNGVFYETWLKQPIDSNKNHLMANGYANSWIINPAAVYKGGNGKRNPDGSYDFELIIEFWPHRLFYIGAIISSIMLILCFGYICSCYFKRRNIVRP